MKFSSVFDCALQVEGSLAAGAVVNAVDRCVGERLQELRLERGHMRERMSAQEIKERLRANTEEAHAAGVIGVPTLRLGGRLYWGDDQLESAAASGR